VLSLTLDTALNLLWLGISVAALLWFGRMEWKRSRKVRPRRLFAVFLATIALFPIVSDSDDLFSFSLLQIPTSHRNSAGTTPEDSREKDTLQLARLLESLDHFQITALYQIVLSLCFVAMLWTVGLSIRSRTVLANPGRAPPLA
jgi:hypothetical protein